jgi:hypothetical protein
VLVVTHATQENFGILMFERSEGAADGILSPALRIRLDRIFKKSVERDENIGYELSQLELADKVRGFGDDKVVAMGQCLTNLRLPGMMVSLPVWMKSGEDYAHFFPHFLSR